MRAYTHEYMLAGHSTVLSVICQNYNVGVMVKNAIRQLFESLPIDNFVRQKASESTRFCRVGKMITVR